MKDFAKTVHDVVTNVEQKFEETARDAMEGNNTSEQKSRQAGKETIDAATETANKEAAQHSHIPEPVVKDVLDAGDQIRAAAPKAFNATKLLFLKIAGGAALAALAVTAIVTGNHNGQQILHYAEDVHNPPDVARLEMQLTMNQAEFSNLLRNFDLSDLPSVPATAEPLSPDRIAVPSPQVAFPPAVQAVAMTPVVLTVQLPAEAAQPAKTETSNTNLAHVYQSIPRARESINNYVEHHGSNIHGEIHVNSGFAGVNISF